MDTRRWKRIARRLGVFGISRSVFRALNPPVRAEIQNDRKLFSSLIAPGDLVFDIGANLGDKARLFLSLGAKVVSVEPNPNCIPYLKSLSSNSETLNVVQAAVGGEQGTATLHFSGTDKTASLRKDWFAHSHAESQLDAREVNVATLTQLTDEFGTPNFCKIDVEGLEAEVLSGLTQQIPLLCFEFHKQELDELSRCVEILERLGPWEYNVIEMNGRDFRHEGWKDRSQFLDTDMVASLPYRGDIFARAKDTL